MYQQLSLATAYAKGVMGLRPQDVWLAAFPRSGSTWLRFLLCNVISLTELDGREVDLHFLDATMPALGRSDLRQSWPFEVVPRFIKTHQAYRRLLFAIPRRAVYVLRDPRDVMVSYYHFERGRAGNAFRGAFGEFIRLRRHGLGACLRHYRSWRRRDAVVIRYEDLSDRPNETLERFLSAFGVRVSRGVLDSAVERSSLQRMKAVEKQSGAWGMSRFSADFEFVRRGVTGEWRDYFSASDLSLYRSLCVSYALDAYP